jgi:hypothetical protein
MALLASWHLRASQCLLYNDLNGRVVARAGRRVSDRRSGGAGGRPGGLAAVNSLDRMVKIPDASAGPVLWEHGNLVC